MNFTWNNGTSHWTGTGEFTEKQEVIVAVVLLGYGRTMTLMQTNPTPFGLMIQQDFLWETQRDIYFWKNGPPTVLNFQSCLKVVC